MTLPDRVRAAVARDFNARYVDRVTADMIAFLSSGEGNAFVREWCKRRGFCTCCAYCDEVSAVNADGNCAPCARYLAVRAEEAAAEEEIEISRHAYDEARAAGLTHWAALNEAERAARKHLAQ